MFVYFYPRSPCGERHGPILTITYLTLFLSTLSLRRATSTTIITICIAQFLSTLSLRRATSCGISAIPLSRFLSTLSLRRATVWPYQRHFPADISIHALLAESDVSSPKCSTTGCYFYPRSPCGERHTAVTSMYTTQHFYPRSPCGERHKAKNKIKRGTQNISIHALLAESDVIASALNQC